MHHVAGGRLIRPIAYSTRFLSLPYPYYATRSLKSTSALPENAPVTKSNNKGKEKEKQDKDAPLLYQNTPSTWEESSFLTPYLRKHPALYKGVKFFYDGMGLYTRQGDAVRLGKKIYMQSCERDIIEERLIYETFKIPRTFHSWFQLTNLHIWLLTIRLRALPPPHGKLFLQSLIDFFFQDIEDRLRSLLGKRISERTINGYMREYKELWNGGQVALDVGLVGGDWELAGAVWRNLWDAKGWDLNGIRGEDGALLSPSPSSPEPVPPSTSPTHTPSSTTQAATLVEVPLHIYTLTAYLRRELKRLEDIPDELIISEGNIGTWGRIEGKEYGDDIPSGPIEERERRGWEKRDEERGIYR